MSPLLLLPSIAFGLFYALTAGNFLMLAFSLLSGLVAWWMSNRKSQVPEGDLRLVGDRVWVGDKRLPRYQGLWSKAQQSRVVELFRDAEPTNHNELRQLRFRNWRPGLTRGYLVGLGTGFQLDEGAGHLLVIGPTGSGKSELIHLVLASLDENVDLAIADYKGGAVLTETTGLTSSTSDIDSVEVQNAFWFSLEQELSRREQHLRTVGVSNFTEAERLGLALPRLLVIVDEVVAAIRTGKAALDSLTKIATKGRSLGVHLLLTTQSLVGLPREILINLRSRLALAGTDDVELMQLGGKEKIGKGTGETKAAVLLHDGQTLAVQVPLGARRAPRTAA